MKCLMDGGMRGGGRHGQGKILKCQKQIDPTYMSSLSSPHQHKIVLSVIVSTFGNVLCVFRDQWPD